MNQNTVTQGEKKRRLTRQRRTVCALLAQGGPFRSAQSLHDLLHAQGEHVGLTTVYRTLHRLAEDGRLDVLRDERGQRLYRRRSAAYHHHHLVCRQCGHAVEITNPRIQQWINATAAKYGYRDIDHELVITGACPCCRASLRSHTSTSDRPD